MSSNDTPSTHAVDMTTTYLGLKLKHPFIAGASPLSAHLDSVRRLEDAGAAAVVLHSLFEEQITEAQSGRIHGIDPIDDPSLAPRVAAFPPASEYPLLPDEYLEHIRALKASVQIPIIASLNGTGAGQWLRQAKLLQEAGADALEVNFYEVTTHASISPEAVEGRIVRAVDDLKRLLKIPVAVKLPPYFSAFAHLASRLDLAGADGLVLFNRFYQPDIDLDTLTATPSLHLSGSEELLLRLRWLAILHGKLRLSLAVTGGVSTWREGVKAILAGAHCVQMVSALLRHGPQHLTSVVHDTRAWMEAHGVDTMEKMRGSVSLQTAADPRNFERGNYIRTLHEWKR